MARVLTEDVIDRIKTNESQIELTSPPLQPKVRRTNKKDTREIELADTSTYQTVIERVRVRVGVRGRVRRVRVRA